MTVDIEKKYGLEPLLAEFADKVEGRSAWSLLSEVSGVSERSLRRWADRGLDDYQADRLAIRSGYHPAELWPTWIEDGLR